ncbi:hypothetical protein [Diaphorobacter sp.]|uniref:hypothetical protein n=1 Tax=Diaphorobacter sp. TaxID=1934310 RepID=UPI00258734BD|nr:hypothetical protein [Diaphorobacter sp.]
MTLAIAQHTNVIAAPSISLSAENRLLLIQSFSPAAVIDVTPSGWPLGRGQSGVGQLLRPDHLDVDGGGAGGMGGGLDVHRRVPWLVDDATIHAQNDQQAKLLFNQSRSKYNIFCDYIENLIINGNLASLARQC